MENLNKVYLYRMTHIENIPHILQFGITHINSPNNNPNYIPIGDGNLIGRRSTHNVLNGKQLGVYIPFYFGKRMPMLYVIQKGLTGVKVTMPENIIYCITSIEQVVKHKLDFIFSDGHAIDGLTTFYDQDELQNLTQIIDQNAIRAKYWKDENDLDLKRRKEAEFLVENDLPSSAILGYVVYNNIAKTKLLDFGISEKQISIKEDYYF